MSHNTCTAQQVIQWASTETPPIEPGTYLCAVETEGGNETHTLEWDGRRHWIHEGDSTLFKNYPFTLYAWAKAIEPPPRDLFPQ